MLREQCDAEEFSSRERKMGSHIHDLVEAVKTVVEEREREGPMTGPL
jgi:hypothetical protein